MIKEVDGWQVADVIADPESVFSHPSEVLNMENLSKKDKRQILESWRGLEEFRTGEIGAGGSSSNSAILPSIEKALDDLA